MLSLWAVLCLLCIKTSNVTVLYANISLFSPPTVPSDVFFIHSVWKGYYEYLGKRQPATLTVDWFNATSSKVNATFTDSQGELKLTGRHPGGSLTRPSISLLAKGAPARAKCWLMSLGLCTCCLSLGHLSDWGRMVQFPHLKYYKTSTEKQINFLQITQRSCYIKDVRFMSR